MALGPPPSQIFSASLRTCDMRSARKRMLASKRAEVGSIFVAITFAGEDEFTEEDSLRSAMGRRSGLFTVYQGGGSTQRGMACILDGQMFLAKSLSRSPHRLGHRIVDHCVNQPEA